MLSRWLGGLAALVVTLVACAMVILDLTDGGLRRWNDVHALTTDTVAGLLVLLITVLVADQAFRLRQINVRARAVAAQAAIVVSQAIRSSQAVSGTLASSRDRDVASDEFRTYMMMLLVAAPVLIDAKVSRDFLEQAQRLGGEMGHALAVMDRASDGTPPSTKRLDAAVKQLKAAAVPLMAQLTPQERAVVMGDDAS